jgi:hypothetical protein
LSEIESENIILNKLSDIIILDFFVQEQKKIKKNESGNNTERREKKAEYMEGLISNPVEHL